ncbi:MAG: hypothetical protein H2069_00730 [Legionella sp.]|nr:hypothetical protein [Legionella sp.]
MDNQNCCKLTSTHLNWAAIFAGALVGMGLGFLLNIFSMAIGLSAYTSVNGSMVVAIGGVLGLLIGSIVAMGVAGFVAGYLGRFYHCYCHGGVIYGFLTWSLAIMLSAALILPVTRYITFYEENLAPVTVTAADVNAAEVSQQQALPSPEKIVHAHPKHLAWNGWILFLFFFLGALASCMGACCGMGCRKVDRDNLKNHPSSL